MTRSPDFYNYPSDVTAESTASGTKTSGIPKDLLAVVGKTEQSFEDELQKIRKSLYLPSKYTASNRSNLHKQLKIDIPEETDSLLGTLPSPICYTGSNYNDDESIQTDEQSHSSKITFGSARLDIPFSGALSAEKVEARIIHAKPQPEMKLQHNASEIEIEDGISIDHFGCEDLMMEIHKNLKMHRLASDYFRFRNFLFFQAPIAILAMASTVVAFMGVSNIVEVSSQKMIIAVAGCCSALVVILHTLSGYCAYGTRASMHDGTTIYLRDLDDDLKQLMSKLMKSEMAEKQQEENTQINEDTFELLQSRYRHSLKGCKSDIPTQITEAFSEINSFILLSKTTTNRKYLKECGMFESQKFRGITVKSYDRLASNMVGYLSWPLKIPCPKMLAKMTIEETRSDLHQMNSFWETPPPMEGSSMPCLPFGNVLETREINSKFANL